MKKGSVSGYLLVALAIGLPLGLRLYTWSRTHETDVSLDMAQAGQVLFEHEWTSPDPLAPGGDGLGPVYNATSCVACHHQGGLGGSGDRADNVTTFTVALKDGPAREGVVHGFANKVPETLADVALELPAVSKPNLNQLIPMPGCRASPSPFPEGVHVSQRQTPALFGDRLIDEIPDRVIIANERKQRLKWGLAPADGEDVPVGRARRLADGRVGRFGWKAQTARLADFVQAACANELGLGNPGQAQPTPLNDPDYLAPGLDLTLEQCDQLTAFVAALPRPVELPPPDVPGREHAAAGKKSFHSIGCADCHTPDLGSVQGLYSDLLLHKMGEALVGGGSYNDPPRIIRPSQPDQPSPPDSPHPSEWRTPPLWGVADSAPYLHDGRAATLDEAIRLHAGQGQRGARKYEALPTGEQEDLVAFLKTLKAPARVDVRLVKK